MQVPDELDESDAMSHKPTVFLAYVSEDRARVLELYDRLSAGGARPWLDEKDLLPGQDWQLEISKALESADYVVACISERSVSKDGFVQQELREALCLQARKPPGTTYLIPLVLDYADVPDLRIPGLGLNLRNIQWVRLNDAEAYAKLFRSLGCDDRSVGPKAPMVSISYRSVADWPYEKACPKCNGVMTLNHELGEYNCTTCRYGEYGP